MKTLLITAFAAVLALQVQGQQPTAVDMLDWGILSELNNSSGTTVYSEYELGDQRLFEKLNSLPAIDSISVDPKDGNPILKKYFDYNSDGQITSIKNGVTEFIIHTSFFEYKNKNLIATEDRGGDNGYRRDNITFENDENGNIKRRIDYGNWINSTTDFNPDGTLKKNVTVQGFDRPIPVTTITTYEYDDKGRISDYSMLTDHDSLHSVDFEGAGVYEFHYEYRNYKFEYTEPTTDNPFLTQVRYATAIDSFYVIRNGVRTDTASKHTSVRTHTYLNNELVQKKIYFEYPENVWTTESYLIKADTVDGLVTKRYTVNQETNKEQLIAKYVYENRNLIQVETDYSLTKIFYAPEPKAKSVQIKGNQVVTVEFNTALDPAIDYAALLTLNNTQLKAETLSISKAYISAGNAKQLVIELNRPIAAGESFEITAAEALPLKDGRTATFSAVVKAQTVTDFASATAKEIQISQTSAGISITAGAEIASVKVFTASGVLALSLQPASNEATISTDNLPAGVYQVFVTDADGNSASQTVSF